MFKKTLLAVAVASLASTSAFAMDLKVTKNGTGDFKTNVIALQTKQDVLDKTTLEAAVELTFINKNNTDEDKSKDVDYELKNAGELIITLHGDAEFNREKVAAFLTDQGPASVEDADFSAIKVATATLAPGGTLTDGSSDGETLDKVFKIDFSNNVASIRHELTPDNKRLSIRLADKALEDSHIRIKFDFNDADLAQAFKLKSGSSSQVRMSIGALQNQSFTADPKDTPVLFKTENLFTLTQDVLTNPEGADATALVSETYNQWKLHTDGFREVELKNNTTNQNIQHRHVKLSLVGDFTGIATKNGKLVDESGAQTNWSVANGVATMTYGQQGNFAGDSKTLLSLPKFAIDKDNEKGLEAQSFALKVEVIDNATFNPYSQQIGNAFVVVRDGMKFDTVTTGSTSDNVIYIRDISNAIPEEGGKIFVTIIEYDGHEYNANADGKYLAKREELPIRLPKNGAVTLTPQGIVEALGKNITPARQARFVFEVETNQGQAAVKKQTSEGVDIQSNAKGAPVDFTL
ncbi:VapA family S-layer protein [Vibrio metschnikovii]|uniref:VapA family S-layer protein n=1 Tax=Vibrio metschnikovii TaxID=28172 RepID=UPI001C301691|nr:hypothetical protein [Vibrio metschnikovii]